ncbi:MAG: DUF4221 family protein [Flavobacteriales bacterium]|nr:DUF4221 family protein [Flavobacteriales bacterium]
MNFSTPDKLPKRYPLNRKLLNTLEFGEISSSYIIGNTLAFFQDGRLGLYDLQRDSIVFQTQTIATDSFPIHLVDYDIPIYYNNSLKDIYIGCVDFRNPEERNYLMDVGFHYRLNWETNNWEILPVKYPESFGEGDLGMSGFSNCCYKGDSILYSFSNENELTIYDKRKGILNKTSAKSKHSEKTIPLDSNDIDNAEKNLQAKQTNFYYRSLIFDKWKNHYYRIYAKEMDLRDKDGFFNTYKEKEYGVVVLDKHLKKVGEISFPDKGMLSFGVSKEGLFYIIQDTTNKHHITYATIDIKL